MTLPQLDAAKDDLAFSPSAPVVPTELDAEAKAVLNEAIRRHFFNNSGQELTPELKQAMWVITDHRVNEFRNNVLPWLRTIRQIGHGTRVLEIGAGTGSSVVVLAETGATVDGIDIIESHLKVAETWLDLHGYRNARVYHRNALDIDDLYAKPYDVIIFSAVFEHMTYEERLKSVRAAWDNLEPGGLLCIYETPNRLWYHDGHTSQLNFYHWLPDDLAMDFAKYSRRAGFDTAFKDGPDAERLARWGRGASYHEFELAIGVESMNIQRSYHQFLCDGHAHYREAYENSPGRKYADFIQSVQPDMHPAFCEEVLSFAAVKR